MLGAVASHDGSVVVLGAADDRIVRQRMRTGYSGHVGVRSSARCNEHFNAASVPATARRATTARLDVRFGRDDCLSWTRTMV